MFNIEPTPSYRAILTISFGETLIHHIVVQMDQMLIHYISSSQSIRQRIMLVRYCRRHQHHCNLQQSFSDHIEDNAMQHHDETHRAVEMRVRCLCRELMSSTRVCNIASLRNTPRSGDMCQIFLSELMLILVQCMQRHDETHRAGRCVSDAFIVINVN